MHTSKYPSRNRRNRHIEDTYIGTVNRNRTVKADTAQASHRQQQTQKNCQPMLQAPTAYGGGRHLSVSKPKNGVKMFKRAATRVPEDLATWDEILSDECKSKTCPSPTSSLSPMESQAHTTASAAVIPTHESVQQQHQQQQQQPSKHHQNSFQFQLQQQQQQQYERLQALAEILQVPVNVNKDDAQQQQGKEAKDEQKQHRASSRHRRSRSLTPHEIASALRAATSAQEFMTFQKFRLGDQINFLLFDPYRTLRFLITELKSRLRTVVPDDVNVQKILMEIQQTVKRIRLPNATEAFAPVTQTSSTVPPEKIESRGRRDATPTSPPTSMAEPECIWPKERCHVIKEDPLINHARKVNSSCQTMVAMPSLEDNVNACQMCEHQVKHDTVGLGRVTECNQNRVNVVNCTSCTDDETMKEHADGTLKQLRSKDHRKDDVDEEWHSYCKILQDAIEILKIKTPTDGTQKVCTQLEMELSNLQRELQKTSSSSLSSPHQQQQQQQQQQYQQQQRQSFGTKSVKESLKVQRKPLADGESERADQEQMDKEERPKRHEMIGDGRVDDGRKVERVEKDTFPDYVAKLDSSTQANTRTISKESQTELKSPTQVLCHLEKEKLQLLQQFRALEMENIQGELEELHVYIKDQLDGIYRSITGNGVHLKFHSTTKTHGQKQPHRSKTGQRRATTPVMPSSSSPSLTALSSVVSVELRDKVGVTLAETFAPSQHGDGNANNIKSMMKQKEKEKVKEKEKEKSSSNSVAPGAVTADAKEHYDISNIDKPNKTFECGEKKCKNYQHQCHCHSNSKPKPPGRFESQQHHVNSRAPVYGRDTPHCNGSRKIHCSSVECGTSCRCPLMPDLNETDEENEERKVMAIAGDTRNDIKSAKRTFQAVEMMAGHQQRHPYHQQSTMRSEQLISSSFPATPVGDGGRTKTVREASLITMQSGIDETTGATIKAIVENAFANMFAQQHNIQHQQQQPQDRQQQLLQDPRRNHQSNQAHNSWQRVNLKNPTGCRPKKQICGNRYECSTNSDGNHNDNRSNCPEIHDCQKCRANSGVNPFGGLRVCPMKIHEVGANNPATTATVTNKVPAMNNAPETADDDDDEDGDFYCECCCNGDDNDDDDHDDDDDGDGDSDDRDDSGASGDGVLYSNDGTAAAVDVPRDFTCNTTGQRLLKQKKRTTSNETGKLHGYAMKESFQTGLLEFKEFLGELLTIILGLCVFHGVVYTAIQLWNKITVNGYNKITRRLYSKGLRTFSFYE